MAQLRIWKQRSLGLRARLTLSYAIGFTLVLLVLGLVFRSRVERVILNTIESTLEDETTIIRKYFRNDDGQISWEFDPAVNEEAFFVRRLRRVLLIADHTGRPLEVSEAYQRLGPEPPEKLVQLFSGSLPTIRLRTAPDGSNYVLRSERVRIDNHDYLVTVGRALDQTESMVRQFTFSYYLMMWPLSVGLALFGWWLAGRGLQPLNDVARAAQSVSSSNLHTLIPMRGADDELDHLISTFNSMTERLEVSFNQMKHFSTDVSHELRTPLTSIRGQLEVALFTAKDESQLREAMIGSIDDVEHLSRLVSALLNLAAAESGQLVVNRDRVDFGQVCANIASRFTEAADVQNLAFKVSCDTGCFVEGDRTQLERLVTNLIANSMKYTPAGGSVSIQVRSADGSVTLVVQDTGRGIAPQHVPHIFDRFYRVAALTGDPARGLGLGLSFVAWIVKAHWGHIDVKSELGQGSTFRVSLPAYNGVKS